jgi:biopolymer transport protein ExbD
MDLSRLRALIAPAMASLFLVLSLCAFVLQRPVSAGMELPITQVRAVPYNDCEDVDRDIVVLLHKDGSYWLNVEQVSASKLGLILGEIYENRKYKLIYIFVDPDVSYGEFARFYDTVASSTPGLRIGMRTRQMETVFQQCPQGSSCGLEWPDHAYIPCVERRLPLTPVHIPRGTDPARLN